MDDKQHVRSNHESLLEAWLKASADFWGTAVRVMPGQSGAFGGKEAADKASKGRVQESLDSTVRTWKAFATVMTEPSAVEGMIKGIGAVPEVLAKILQPAWQGFFHLQEDFLERASRIGKSTAAYNFENLDQEAFKAWLEVYEKEFKKFLQVPQLGLLRVYQERLTEATDKFNVFQATMAEFVSLLYLPMERSYKVMQEKLGALASEGKLPENSKEYYRMWIKVLEGHYMTLFKSPEYVQEMAKTIDAMGEFNEARQRILEDILQFLPVPTQKDMDDLYKELYIMKKRIKDLEKKQTSAEPLDEG